MAGEQEPWGTRLPLQHPRAHRALVVVVLLLLAPQAVTGALDLVRGPHRDGAMVLAEIFRLVLVVGAVMGLRTAIRIRRDPRAEVERRQRVRERALALPREVLVRKAAAVLALMVLVTVGAGSAVIAFDRGTDQWIGWFLVVLGLTTGAYGAWRLRHPPT